MSSQTVPSGASQQAGRLAGRVAIVTGAGGGIGSAVAATFVREGAKVLVADLPGSSGQQVSDALGDAAAFCPLEVTNPEEWNRAVEACRSDLGAAPDILVNSAGVMVLGTADTCDPQDAIRAFTINAMGSLHGIQAVASAMREGKHGSIVLISSGAGGAFGVPGMTPYAMSKAAVAALGSCAAMDFKASGIRVNTIVPGQIDTPMSRSVGIDLSLFDKLPVPRQGEPDDIAQAALYLASDESAWVSGTTLEVDGGMNAGPLL